MRADEMRQIAVEAVIVKGTTVEIQPARVSADGQDQHSIIITGAWGG